MLCLKLTQKLRAVYVYVACLISVKEAGKLDKNPKREREREREGGGDESSP